MSEQIPGMFSGRKLFTLFKRFLEFDNLEAPPPPPTHKYVHVVVRCLGPVHVHGSEGTW